MRLSAGAIAVTTFARLGRCAGSASRPSARTSVSRHPGRLYVGTQSIGILRYPHRATREEDRWPKASQINSAMSMSSS